MGKNGAFLFYYLFGIFVFTSIFSSTASDEDRKVYIVYMGSLQDKLYSPTSHHASTLQSVLEGSSVSTSLVRSYNRSFDGFAAKLTEKERVKLASLKGVISIFRNKILKTQTTRSWDFMGFPEAVKRNPTVESDTIIGLIDTGIWPESKSFSDEGFGPPPKKWKGACDGGEDFTCNNKIIGARYYPSSGVASARDSDGHGSHTASTAAGNSVKHVSFYGVKEGTARGAVPSARIAAYSVCSDSGCSSEALLAAFDDAIADGVDIISISIGFPGAVLFEKDPIAIGSFHAWEKGILTLNAAGNKGPTPRTMSSVAPWLMAVAASTIDQRVIDRLVLGNGTTITGNVANTFRLSNRTNFPVIYGKKASRGCSDWSARSCEFGCLDRGLVKGKIVVYDSVEGISEAFTSGAVGCITQSDIQLKDVSSVVPFPTSILNQEDFTAFLSYLNSTKYPKATISRSEAIRDYAAPTVASFSSRGPNIITPDILKPDIIAPGVSILAAFSPINTPSVSPDDKRRVKYNIESGTSMACPHVAGAAAYVKTFHPDWSPSAIKSSLMTTALLVNNTSSDDGEFGYGSGHVNPTQAINPGLVYEVSGEDYKKFLCNIGYDETKIKLISGNNSSCPKGSEKGSPRDLNYPSFTAQVPARQSYRVVFHRRVKNVGHANSTYKAKIFSSKSLTGIQVVPNVLSFKSLNEEKSFDVIINGGGLSDNSMVSASLVWSDGTHNVRSPIVLHNITIHRISEAN